MLREGGAEFVENGTQNSSVTLLADFKQEEKICRENRIRA